MKVAVFSRIIHKAIRTGAGGAIRLYFLARSAVADGRGYIPETQLDLIGKQLDVNPRTWRQWKKDALDMRFLIRGKNDNLSWIAIERVAQELELTDVGHQFEIFAALLVRRDWKAYVFAGFQTQFNRPVSRKTLKQVSGVGVSTQRKYDCKAGTNRTANFTTIENPTEKEMEAAGKKRSPYFVGSNGKVIRRLPDSREVSKAIAVPKPFGRMKKVKEILRHQIGYSLEVGDGNLDEAVGKKRLFFNSQMDYLMNKKYMGKWEQTHVFVREKGTNKWRMQSV